jgi:hypothetical protein
VNNCTYQVAGDGPFGFGRRSRLVKRGNGEQFVDRRRFVLLFGEPVALGERRHLVGADPLDEAIEVLPDSRLGAGAIGRFQQYVERSIEFCLGLIEVTVLERALAGFEALGRCGDEFCDGIDLGGRRGRRDGGCGNNCRRRNCRCGRNGHAARAGGNDNRGDA